MRPVDSARTSPPESADTARARLVGELRQRGSPVLSRPAAQAFARVPRHVFVPEVGAAAAYRDEALVIKCEPDGTPVSSSSQPAMMAIMLDQLGLEPGHRVLEIGTGSGYNAAVMSAVVGPDGEVVSIDIDPELVGRARASLAAAGFDAVRVVCADGGYGDPDGAPYDRIIVTAGAWDIAPAWLEQLAPGGLLVVPLSLRGLQLSVALRRQPGRSGAEEWTSTSAWRCGFVRMLGAFAGPERPVRETGQLPLVAQMADGRAVDGPGLQAALAGPVVDVPLALALSGPADLADLDLWLTFAALSLDRVVILAAPGDWFPLAPLLPLGALVSSPTEAENLGVATLLPADIGRGAATSPPEAQLMIRGFGPGGGHLATSLAGRAATWAELGRPGAADLQLAVRLRTDNDAASPSAPVVLRRPSVVIEAGWTP